MLERARHAVAVAIAVSALAARADSIDCPGGLVRTGDAKIDVLARCGQPSLVEGGSREKGVFDVRAGVGRRVVAPVDVWTYDFGPSRFVQRFRIERGHVRTISPGSWGAAAAPPARTRPRKAACQPSALSVGKLTIEVLSRCGEPAVRDEWEEEIARVLDADGQVVFADVVSRTVAQWTYDFGPGSFVRFVRVEDGVVTRVDTGSYGYGE